MKNFVSAGAISLAFVCTSLSAQEASFGAQSDADYAALIWEIMVAERLVGDKAIATTPYEGGPPHGAMLQTFYSTATIDGHTGDLIVKRNYGPEEVSAEQVLADPGKHLGAITIMYRREAGFDDDNQNWFWVKYRTDGSVDKNPEGMMLAGRVAKGADEGCIACHSGVDDYIFTADHITPDS